MRVIQKQESAERCAEAGWYAWDCLLDNKMDRDFILSLRPLGSFVYLEQLRQPFFKIEGDYFLLKGIEGKASFRLAFHGNHEETAEEILNFIQNPSSPSSCFAGSNS